MKKDKFEQIWNSMDFAEGMSMQSMVMAAYAKWAKRYDQDMRKNPAYPEPYMVGQQLIRHLGNKTESKILDVGAGTGLMATEVAKCGFHNIDALDGCKEMLQIAKEKDLYKKLICVYMDSTHLDIKNETYDAIVSSGAFAPDHADDGCFDELIRITKPGGLLVISTRHYYIMNDDRFKTFEQKIKSLQEAGYWMLLNPENIIQDDDIFGKWDSMGALHIYVLKKCF